MEKIISNEIQLKNVIIEFFNIIEEGINSLRETVEILSDKELLESINRGIQDVLNNNIINFEDYQKRV